MSDQPAAQRVIEEPWLFEFFQAVRLLELEAPRPQRVGGDAFPEQERVRFEPWLSLAFPPATVQRVEPPDAERKAYQGAHVMVVSFMGTHGPQGVLPRHYTELLLERARAGDHGLRAFLDMFNHRFISLFFRANEKYRTAASCRAAGDDPISSVLFSLMGLTPATADGDHGPVPRRHLLRYCGLWTQKPRSHQTVEALVRDYFDGLPVAVVQFIGRWVLLPEADQGRVGGTAARNGLDGTMVVGARVWDRQGAFRLRIGPLPIDGYLDFQPEGRAFETLCALVREFVGDHLAFDVQPVLRAPDVPELELRQGASPAPRIGRTTWLLSRPCTRDADDATFPAPATLAGW